MIKKRDRSNWADYIEDSQSRSSSAMATAESFIKLAGISQGSRILDLGCGHGRITELLVERVPNLDLVGVDMTPHLLDSFVVESGTNGARINLMLGDITRLPFGDADFDVAISSRVFQYLPDPLAGVREAVRVLKPGGVLAIAIPNKLNPVKYITYKAKLHSPFQVRDWFRTCGLQQIVYRSICFFPSTVKWGALASSFELAGYIPAFKYLGGNVMVVGTKKS